MVQACRNGQTPYHLRILICGIVCYGAALAPTITSAFGQYDVLREIEAQQRLAAASRSGGGGYPAPEQLQPYARSAYDDEDVERLGSYLDEFMGSLNEDRAMQPVQGSDQALLREIEAQVAKIRFPRLTGRQKDFAVHPGYPHYYNHELRQIEDEIEKRKGALRGRSSAPKPKEEEDSGIDEVAEDPFEGRADNDKEDKGMTFGKVRQAPEGVPVTVEQVEDAILKKADADGGVVITGLDRDGSGGLQIGDVSFTVIVAVCSAVAAFTIVLAGVIYHRLQRNTKAAEDVEYPAYGVTAAGGAAGGSARHDGGSAGSPTSGGSANGDRKLAQNAQMYHYQHQKQQMIAFDSHQNGGNRNRLGSDDNDSDEGEEGDYTVYECPGLAPTGEMEVRNPMFSDDQTTPKAANQK